MDQFIFNIILAVLAAIVLSQILKGVLRLVAIAVVSLTLVVVSANISGSSNSLPSLFNWLNADTSSPVIEESSSSTGGSSPPTSSGTEDIASSSSATSGTERGSVSPGTTSELEDATPPPDNTSELVREVTSSTDVTSDTDSAFTGVTAMVGSDQDPVTDRILPETVSSSASSLESAEGNGLNQTRTEQPANSSVSSDNSPRPINALW